VKVVTVYPQTWNENKGDYAAGFRDVFEEGMKFWRKKQVTLDWFW
jgi:hypothetical protein